MATWEVTNSQKPEMRLLDTDTGGGAFLLSLNHPHKNTAATEGYPPNVELCRKILLPLGIDFRPGDGTEKLPFDDDSFDMVINRHGDFIPSDIYRLPKPGGIFVESHKRDVYERNTYYGSGNPRCSIR